jgi:hypothetical protein
LREAGDKLEQASCTAHVAVLLHEFELETHTPKKGILFGALHCLLFNVVGTMMLLLLWSICSE